MEIVYGLAFPYFRLRVSILLVPCQAVAVTNFRLIGNSFPDRAGWGQAGLFPAAILARAFQIESSTAETYCSSEKGLRMYDFNATIGSP